MKNLELKNLILELDLFNKDYSKIIEWAVKKIENNDYNDDICVLASLNKNETYEIRKTIENIIGENIKNNIENLSLMAGKKIYNLYLKYSNKEINLAEIEFYIGKFYLELNYPKWLFKLRSSLSIFLDFNLNEKEFEKEFSYISNLWKTSNSLNEFLSIF